jgi:hypothetical protein
VREREKMGCRITWSVMNDILYHFNTCFKAYIRNTNNMHIHPPIHIILNLSCHGDPHTQYKRERERERKIKNMWREKNANIVYNNNKKSRKILSYKKYEKYFVIFYLRIRALDQCLLATLCSLGYKMCV